MPISPVGLLDRVFHGRAPQPITSILPLQGLTVLAVEDSRFASDALRLMCQRSGARLRRVDTLQSAYAHLRVYRPDVMLVDLGLPDGRGDALIADVSQHRPQGPIVIGISGDDTGQAIAMAAGAHGFIAKPFPSLAAFQGEILRHLPDRADRSTPNPSGQTPRADPLAMQDDLERAALLLDAGSSAVQRRYVAGFLGGIALTSGDHALAAAAQALADPQGLEPLRTLLAQRLKSTTDTFAGPCL